MATSLSTYSLLFDAPFLSRVNLCHILILEHTWIISCLTKYLAHICYLLSRLFGLAIIPFGHALSSIDLLVGIETNDP